MKKLSVFVIVSFCACADQRGKMVDRNDSAIQGRNLDTIIAGENKFFRIADTLKDIQYLDSFFVLIYNDQIHVPIRQVQKYFHSNEEEMCYLDANIKDKSKRNLMIDSIFNSESAYVSKFFPSLAKIIRNNFPKRSSVKIRFNGFDIIDETANDPYDTTYVNYHVSADDTMRKLNFKLAYLRDRDFGIGNIYHSNGESLIDEACGSGKEEK